MSRDAAVFGQVGPEIAVTASRSSAQLHLPVGRRCLILELISCRLQIQPRAGELGGAFNERATLSASALI